MRPVKEIKWENCYKTYCQDEFGVFHKDLSGAKKKMKRLSILVESSAHKSSTHGCCDEFYEMITICAYDYGNIMSSHYCTVVDLWHIKSFPIALYKMYSVYSILGGWFYNELNYRLIRSWTALIWKRPRSFSWNIPVIPV